VATCWPPAAPCARRVCWNCSPPRRPTVSCRCSRPTPPPCARSWRWGAEFFRRTFGPTRGLWLPECAFYPGLESELRAQGFSWFVVDTHGLHHASHRPQHGVLAPIACPNGVAAFGRDPDSSRQVWSAQEGYPGDFFYREFHRDIAHQRSLEHLGPCLLDGAIRVPTGLKYWRVTGSDEKALYEPERAQERVREHARHFVAARCAQLERAAPGMDRPPLALAPYDAELFGHWWFEGPQFLEQVLREAAAGGLELLTPSDYLDRHPVCSAPPRARRAGAGRAITSAGSTGARSGSTRTCTRPHGS
jgi:1,4-alpha-glucan branching enzyme